MRGMLSGEAVIWGPPTESTCNNSKKKKKEKKKETFNTHNPQTSSICSWPAAMMFVIIAAKSVLNGSVFPNGNPIFHL